MGVGGIRVFGAGVSHGCSSGHRVEVRVGHSGCHSCRGGLGCLERCQCVLGRRGRTGCVLHGHHGLLCGDNGIRLSTLSSRRGHQGLSCRQGSSCSILSCVKGVLGRLPGVRSIAQRIRGRTRVHFRIVQSGSNGDGQLQIEADIFDLFRSVGCRVSRVVGGFFDRVGATSEHGISDGQCLLGRGLARRSDGYRLRGLD